MFSLGYHFPPQKFIYEVCNVEKTFSLIFHRARSITSMFEGILKCGKKVMRSTDQEDGYF
jgi:hypothetical protein